VIADIADIELLEHIFTLPDYGSFAVEDFKRGTPRITSRMGSSVFTCQVEEAVNAVALMCRP
jgi:hypothetical protein